MITIGASIFLRGGAQVIFDKQAHKIPAFSGESPIVVMGAAIQPQSIWVLGSAAVLFAALYGFLNHTLLGKAMRATAANRLAARLVGINTRTIMALAFATSAAIGALAGILIAPITLTSYDAGIARKGWLS